MKDYCKFCQPKQNSYDFPLVLTGVKMNIAVTKKIKSVMVLDIPKNGKAEMGVALAHVDEKDKEEWVTENCIPIKYCPFCGRKLI